MPTIHREAGFRIEIYPKDHGIPHVHAWKAGGKVKIAIGDEDTPAFVLEAERMRTKDIVRAVRIVDAHWEGFLAEWRRIHG